VVHDLEYIKTIKQLKMKTILNLKPYVILFIAAFAMTSCLDSDDAQFMVYGAGYVAQEVTELRENEISSKFIPILYVSSSAYDHQINSCACKSPSGEMIPLTKMNEYIWVSNTLFTGFSDLSSVNGSYTLTATNLDNEMVSGTAMVSASKSMRSKFKGTVTYDPETKKITADFVGEVKDADTYAIILEEEKYSFFKIYLKTYTAENLKISEWKAEYTLTDRDLTGLASGTYRLSVVAGIKMDANGSSAFSIYQEGIQSDRVTKE